MTGPIIVVSHDINVKDVIGTSNRCRILFPISSLMKIHVNAVTRNRHAILLCLILKKHGAGLGNSIRVHIDRIYKDGTMF